MKIDEMNKKIDFLSKFRIYKIKLNEIILYEINSKCRCNIEYVCLKYYELINEFAKLSYDINSNDFNRYEIKI